MFTEKQIENYADALLWGLNSAKRTGFQADDVIMIKAHFPAIKLVEALFRKLLAAKLQPIVRILMTETMELDYYTIADDKQLAWLYPWWKDEYQHVRGSIYIGAQTSLTHLKDIDPKRYQIGARAMKPWREFVDSQEQKDLFSWTLGIWPMECKAEQAGIPLSKVEEQIIKACYLDSDDVKSDWNRTSDSIDDIKTKLSSMDIDHLRMKSDNIDLKITLGQQRKFEGGGGHNIPSFEIFTSPDWRGTEGVFYADLPSFRGGNIVEGVRLEFKDGVVVKASAKKGEDFLLATLDTDEDSRKVGEYSLTDIRHSKIDNFMADTLFDENFGGKHGNSHIAIGSSYADTYAGDQEELTPEKKKELGFTESVVHWDLINTEDKVVTAVMKDGTSTIIYEHGMFTI